MEVNQSIYTLINKIKVIVELFDSHLFYFAFLQQIIVIIKNTHYFFLYLIHLLIILPSETLKRKFITNCYKKIVFIKYQR